MSESNLTIEDITSFLTEIFYGERSNSPRKVVYSQFCRGKGTWVRRDGVYLNQCSDPDCISCRYLDQLLKEGVDNFL